MTVLLKCEKCGDVDRYTFQGYELRIICPTCGTAQVMRLSAQIKNRRAFPDYKTEGCAFLGEVF